MMQGMPRALMTSGACSLEEPQPKFFACYNDVSRFDLTRKLRAKRGETVLFHIFNGL